MAATIGTYNYTYGAGHQPNRQIQFSRRGPGAEMIQAEVFVLNAGIVGTCTSIIGGNLINVEMQSTSEKMRAMMLARENFTDFVPVPDQQLSKLNTAQQNGVIRSLAPTGTKSIEISNSPGAPGGLEVVTHLKISDPG